MSENATLKAQTVQETMLIPLWGRAKFSHLYPELLDDPQSSEIITQVKHDFSQIERAMGEYGGLAYLVRAYRFDNALKAYLATHPQATVVNLGAGLRVCYETARSNKNSLVIKLDSHK
jgi:O-methyltransferase involved in polyketide biosynthesis